MGWGEVSNPRKALSQTAAYDRYSRMLQSGDLVLITDQAATLWRVKETKPSMAIDAPPGLVEIALVAALIQGVPGGAPLMNLVRVLGVDERPAVEES